MLWAFMGFNTRAYKFRKNAFPLISKNFIDAAFLKYFPKIKLKRKSNCMFLERAQEGPHHFLKPFIYCCKSSGVKKSKVHCSSLFLGFLFLLMLSKWRTAVNETLTEGKSSYA